MASGEQGGQIDLGTLSTQQLAQVKKQLDEEVEHLTNSYANLKGAQTQFRQCIGSVKSGVAESTKGTPLLVPLTPSLYVPGQLASTEHVIVDIGTGFYIEKTTEDALKFYNAKIEELGKSIKDLENIVNSKTNNLRVVEEVLRQKVLAGSAPGAQQQAAPAA